jgi:hypothetical protein
MPRSQVIPSPETIVLEFPLAAPLQPSARRLAAPTIARRSAYRVIRTTQRDPYDSPLAAADIASAGVAPAARRPAGDAFQGTARRAAKISIANAPVERFDDLRDLIDSLPADSAMTRRRPRITTGANSNRVDEEKRNVAVRAFLYAASRENDNDFHLIVGRARRLAPVYMTMELSGLPRSTSAAFATLKRTRDDFKRFFGDHPLGLPGLSYDFYIPPVPIEIQGSLFFDMSHARGSKPGPDDLRPDMPTIWEIHPVTRIVFEP